MGGDDEKWTALQRVAHAMVGIRTGLAPSRVDVEAHLAEAAVRMRTALASTGVRMADVRTPDLTRAAWSGTLNLPPGAEPLGIATPGVAPRHPEPPHSAEQESDVTELKPSREPSPEERREAWLSIVQALEGWLLATEQRELSAVPFLEAMEAAIVHTGVTNETTPRAIEEAKARAWAARRIVEMVRHWHAPEVPRDDERGQGDLLELFPGADSTAVENPGDDDRPEPDGPVLDHQGDTWRRDADGRWRPHIIAGHTMNPDLMLTGLDWATLQASIPEEEDDGRAVHWVSDMGAMLHAVHNASRPPKGSGDEDEVTCRRCLHLLHQNAQGH